MQLKRSCRCDASRSGGPQSTGRGSGAMMGSPARFWTNVAAPRQMRASARAGARIRCWH